MDASLLNEIRVFMYHPRYCGDGERGLRIVSAFLGRALRHGQLAGLTDDEARALAAHLREEFPDRSPAAVRRAVDELSRRR